MLQITQMFKRIIKIMKGRITWFTDFENLEKYAVSVANGINVRLIPVALSIDVEQWIQLIIVKAYDLVRMGYR